MEQAKETKNVNMYIGCLVNSDLQITRQGKWKIGDHVEVLTKPKIAMRGDKTREEGPGHERREGVAGLLEENEI